MFRKRKSGRVDFATHPYTDKPFLVVSGMGRSGTTLLRNAVAAHSQIAARNHESNYIHDLLRAAQFNFDKPHRLTNLPVTATVYWQLHRQMILHLLWPVETLDAAVDPRMIATYTQLEPRSMAALEAVFADVHYFYIIRNGIEVVSSYRAFDAFSHLSFDDVCRMWALRREVLDRGAEDPHFSLFRYEWLLDRARFEVELAAAWERCGLAAEPGCLAPLDEEFHPTRLPDESVEDAADLARRGQRWRYWTADERCRFGETCRGLMDFLGYPIPWEADG